MSAQMTLRERVLTTLAHQEPDSAGQSADAVKTRQPQLIGMSALLTTTMPSMKKIIDALQEAGLRGQVKVLIGSAPVTEAYANRIIGTAVRPMPAA
jgi:5-methyltetrahydrofolate--homocysteine methyltransferase